jgi:dolichol kinase
VALFEKEGENLKGAIFFSLGAVLLHFSEHFLPFMLVLSVSDALSAVVGKLWGRIKILNLTLEGSLSFFLSSFLILSAFFAKQMSAIGATVLTMVEYIPYDDNITIPLACLLLDFLVL